MIIRYAVITDEVSQDLQTTLDLCVREGIEGVEIRSVWGKPPLDLTLDDARKIRSLCDKAGRQIIGFDSPVGKVQMPTTEHEISVEQQRLRKSAELAVALGAEWIRVFTFLRDDQISDDQKSATLNEVYGAHQGPTLMFETGTETNTPTAARTASLLRHAGLDANAKVLWDPGNTMFAGYTEHPDGALIATSPLARAPSIGPPSSTVLSTAITTGGCRSKPTCASDENSPRWSVDARGAMPLVRAAYRQPAHALRDSGRPSRRRTRSAASTTSK